MILLLTLTIFGLCTGAVQLAPVLRIIPKRNADFSFDFPAPARSEKTAIAFYFDFSSPYGYFAACRIEQLAARHGRKVEWCPILMPAIFKVTGAVPLLPVPVKGAYILRDFARTARLHGIAWQPAENFPMVSLAPARAMLWITGHHGHRAAALFSKRCYDAYFGAGRDICADATLADIAVEQGIDSAALLAGIRSEAIKRAFQRANERAIAQGVFGSPFFIVDGEQFWGFDRMYQLDAYLQGHARLRNEPGDGADWCTCENGMHSVQASCFKYHSI